MKRQVPGLADATRDSRPEVPDGIFLVRVDGAQFRWHAQKPFYLLAFRSSSPTLSPIGLLSVGRNLFAPAGSSHAELVQARLNPP